jgi:hypothetical protein
MQRHWYDQPGCRPGYSARRFANQRLDDGPRCRIEARETGSRVLEAMDPALDVTTERDRGHASRER